MTVRIALFCITLAAGTLAASQSQPPTGTPPAQPPSGTSQNPTGQTPAPQNPTGQTTAPQNPTGQTTAPQNPTGQTTAAPPPAVPASRKFTSDAGIVFSTIKSDKTADFESIMGRVKEALSKSSDPKRKQMALTWRVFKGLEAGPGGSVVYVWIIDPPIKDVEYTVTDILREAFPNEAQDLWAKYVSCFVSGQTMLNLQLTTNMSPNSTTPK